GAAGPGRPGPRPRSKRGVGAGWYTPENGHLPADLMTGVLDAPTLRRTMTAFAEALREHRAELDSMNVFPVPDGDTGTNLLATQEAVVAAMADVPEGLGQGLPAMCRAVTNGSLMGARGNSGLILSQVLWGLCEGA